LNDASAAFRAFCCENGLGAREAGNCQIWSGDKVVAHVSFNGNIWAGATWKRNGDLLFNCTGLERKADGAWDLPESIMQQCTVSAMCEQLAKREANQHAIAILKILRRM